MTRDTLPQNTLSRNVLPQNTEPQNIRHPEGTTGPDELDEPEVETASYSGRRPGRRWVRVLRRLLLTALACGLAALLGFGVLLGVTPSVADARSRVDAQAAEHGARALSGALPSRVVAALIATEDSRFYSHQGIDPLGAIRGLSQPLFGGPDRGGASLDQQLVKLLYTGGRRDTIDQIEQTALAVKLDAHYSKDEILRMYLDTVYFGHGYYGIVAAAAGYFGQTPGTLTWTQASLLAGLVQAPSAYDPYEHLAAARARQRHVLDRLVATGRLTATQATQVLSAPLDLR